MSEDKVFTARALKSSPYHERNNPHGFLYAPVDIIIPFHDEHDKVGRLIESIFNTVRTNRYQISLVDDGSANEGFVNQFKQVPGVVAFRHPEQKGFGAAVNTAVQNTKQPYILILHSDVIVKGNTWLSKLGETYNNLRERGIKMVGSMTDNPVVDDDRMKGERGKVTDDFILGDGFLPMYCALCKRGLFQKIGPLKEYAYAGGEAEEFAARMRHFGYRQAVCGSSWVQHEGRGTLKRYDEDTSVNRRIKEAMKKASETAEMEINLLKK